MTDSVLGLTTIDSHPTDGETGHLKVTGAM